MTTTVTTNMITVNFPKADAVSPELMAQLEELRLEMPEMTVEQILSRIISKRVWDHLSALAS